MSILEVLGLPNECLIHSKIPKKIFLDNKAINLKSEDKILIKDFIESIYIECSIKKSNVNIEKFIDEENRYEEIQVLKVKIKKKEKEKKISELLQKHIQYPMVIFIEWEEEIKISCGIKKINKLEKEKLLLEETITTDWIKKHECYEKEKEFFESLKLENLNRNNLYLVYEGVINSIKKLNISKYKENFSIENKDIEKNIKILHEIESLGKEINSIKNKIKKEKSIGKRVDLKIEKKKLQEKIEDLKEKLK